VSAADRTVVAAIAFMFVAIPLYGTFQVFDPLRAPMPVLVGFDGALAIALAMLLAAAICALGAGSSSGSCWRDRRSCSLRSWASTCKPASSSA
jgi:hypothetical protein